MMGRLLVALCLAAVGCGTFRAYEGGARPRTEVARLFMSDAKGEGDTVETQSGAYFTGLSTTYSAVIVRVDDREVGSRSSVEVLPGRHEVEIEWERRVPGDVVVKMSEFGPTLWDSSYEGRAILSVDASAGKEYRLTWDRAPSIGTGDRWDRFNAGLVAHFEECE